MELKKGLKQTEVGAIPEDWDAPLLGELFTFKNGLNKAKAFFGYGTPIVNYMDVYGKRGLTVSDIQGRVSLSQQELKTFEVRKGDVFFTRTSETADEVGITSVMLEEPKDTVFSGFVLRARPKDESLDDKFKQCCFSTKNVRKQIVSQSTETTRALTNGRYLSAVAIARPPKPEQRAITAALSDVDELLVALDALIAKKRAIKQGTMQELLTGKRRLPGFSREWKSRTIQEMFEFLDTANNSRSELSASGIVNYLHYGDIHTRWKTFLDCDKEVLPFISENKVRSIPLLEDGDLIMADASEDYGGIGVSVEIKNIRNRKVVAGLHTLALRGDKKLIADGFKAYLQYIPSFKNALIKISVGISVYGISKNTILRTGRFWTFLRA